MRKIIVLCDDYEEADWLYNVSFEYLEMTGLSDVKKSNDYNLTIETITNDCYMFIDRAYLDIVASDLDYTIIVIGAMQYLEEMDGYPIDEILCLKTPYVKRGRRLRRVS